MNRLLACRVCLAYNTHLCSIADGQLREIYEKLVEASLDTEDMLPTSVCYICNSLMKKMLQFRDRSQKANQILQQIISSGLEPSVSSLDMLVKNQTGIFWTLGISDVERTTTTSAEDKVKVKIETVKSEIDIDEMTNWNEGAAPPAQQKLEENEAENELVNIQTPVIETEKDEEPRENKEDQTKIFYFKKDEMIISNIISENQNQSAFNKNDTVTPSKDIFTCDLCKNDYQCKILLESHMKKSHVMEFTRNDSIISDLNVANECKTTNLLKVREIKNNDNRKENSRRENKNTRQYKCQYCMKRFQLNSTLTAHLKIHTKEKPYKCDICEKCFSLGSHLTRHLRVHSKPLKCDTSRYKCQYCMKRFPFKSFLTRHLKVHTKERPFKCDICEKVFSQGAHLNRHLRVHTKLIKCDIKNDDNRKENSRRENKNQYKCQYCMKQFPFKSFLTIHLRFHTKEKPFKCDICEKGFSQKATLTIHLRVHTKEKPFKCDLCEKGFSLKHNLTKHLRVHTKEKPFKCDICEKGFSVKFNLTKHLKVHTKEKLFKCDICEKCFSLKSNLPRHLRVHTKEKRF